MRGFLVLLECPSCVRFNWVYFTVFRAKVWKVLIFEWIFVAENSKKLQKLGLKGKISWVLNVFTLPNLEIFNSENMKNKECVHTWANGTGYMSAYGYKEVWCVYFVCKGSGQISPGEPVPLFLVKTIWFMPTVSSYPLQEHAFHTG